VHPPRPLLDRAHSVYLTLTKRPPARFTRSMGQCLALEYVLLEHTARRDRATVCFLVLSAHQMFRIGISFILPR
jgi:hypothetical protein